MRYFMLCLALVVANGQLLSRSKRNGIYGRTQNIVTEFSFPRTPISSNHFWIENKDSILRAEKINARIVADKERQQKTVQGIKILRMPHSFNIRF